MKKLISILLTIALILGLLVGCGGSTAPAASGSEPAVSASETEPAPEPEAEEPAEPEAEEAPEAEAGYTAEASAEAPVEEALDEPQFHKVDYQLPLFPEQKTISLFYVLRGAMGGGYTPSKDSEESIFWSRVQESLNVDLEFTEPSEAAASESYNLMIAGGDMTDLICENNLAGMGQTCAYNGGYDKAIADEVYVDLLDCIDYAPNGSILYHS